MHTAHIKKNNAAGLSECTVNLETYPLRLLAYDAFKRNGKIEKFENIIAQCPDMLVDSRELNREESLCLMVSHEWLTSGTALNVAIVDGEHAGSEGRLTTGPSHGKWPADKPEREYQVVMKGGQQRVEDDPHRLPQHCPKGHRLTEFQTAKRASITGAIGKRGSIAGPTDGYCCSGCEKVVAQGTSMEGCKECAFDLCHDCYAVEARVVRREW
jgi:hypothetical protein